MTGGRIRVVAAATVLVAMPAPALACPVCFSGTADVLAAYFATAAVLSVLPLAFVGGIILWFRRRTRA